MQTLIPIIFKGQYFCCLDCEWVWFQELLTHKIYFHKPLLNSTTWCMSLFWRGRPFFIVFTSYWAIQSADGTSFHFWQWSCFSLGRGDPWPRSVTIESLLESGCGLHHKFAQGGCNGTCEVRNFKPTWSVCMVGLGDLQDFHRKEFNH